MPDGYFARLIETTQSRVWVNNPTLHEVELSLQQGAVGCTTNPAFAGGLLKRAPAEIRPVVSAVVRELDDDSAAAEEIQRRLVARILPRFREIHHGSDGQLGFVSLQGPPEADNDAEPILASAEQARRLAPNCVPKIPATAPGLEAFAELVADGQPTLVTEVFSLAQIAVVADRYREVTARTRRKPPFIMAPITGIFGDHLHAVARRRGLAADAAVIEWAGVVFARAAARLVRERQYPVTLLFGGARTPLDLTGLIGDRHQVTVNWGTFEEILAADPDCRVTIHDHAPEAVVAALERDFDDFRKAMDLGALHVDDFEAFGPVQHFRNNFLAGWNALLAAIRSERATPDPGSPPSRGKQAPHPLAGRH